MDIRPNVLSKLNQTGPEEIAKYPSRYSVEAKKTEGPKVTRGPLAATRDRQPASATANSMSAASRTDASTRVRSPQGGTAALRQHSVLSENFPLKPQPESPATGSALNVSIAISSVTGRAISTSNGNATNPPDLMHLKAGVPIHPDAKSTSQDNHEDRNTGNRPMVKASPRLTKMQELEILRAKQDFENAGAVVKEKEQISSAAARKSFLVDLATCGSSDIENRLSTLNSMMNKGALTRGQKLKAAAFKASGVALNALGVAATVLAFTFPPAAAACLGLAALIGVARMAYTASIGLRIQQGLQANRDTMKATFERRVGQSGPSIDPTEAMDAPIRKNARLTATQATINGIGVAGMVAGAAGFAGSAGLTGFAAGMVSNFAPLFGLPGLIIGAGAIVLNAVGTAWANAAIKNHPAPAAASKSISFNIEK